MNFSIFQVYVIDTCESAKIQLKVDVGATLALLFK